MQLIEFFIATSIKDTGINRFWEGVLSAPNMLGSYSILLISGWVKKYFEYWHIVYIQKSSESNQSKKDFQGDSWIV